MCRKILVMCLKLWHKSLALVIRTENVIGGSRMMDIQPLMMLEE